MPTARPRVLYVSYDGALQPLGQSQVVAYLERLAACASITLLSFEKPADLADPARVDAMRRRLAAVGIAWLPGRYHKRPAVLSTAFDVLAGCRVARRWCRDRAAPRDAAVVHVRGYVSALIGLYAKRMSGARLLFDMRGFWVDEKVEAGHWPRGGILHRAGKWWERRFLARADAIVSLTAAGVRELPALGPTQPGIPIVVIPTCVDLDRFMPRDAADRNPGARVVGCVGTLSNWYLRDETLAFLAWLCRTPRTSVLMVTREDHDRIRADARRAGVPDDRLTVTEASFDEMPRLIQRMDVGVFFIRPCFSKRASAATKLAEFLGTGVPVVINDGIGDSGEIVRSNEVGVVLPDTSPAAFERAAAALDHLLADAGVRGRCRAGAERLFSLSDGAARYAALYRQLSQQAPAP
jgi:glycosyltransferase involved in cell wall biosynthesis